MGSGVGLSELKMVIDELLADGPKQEAVLLMESARQFIACEPRFLADAVAFILHSSYVHVGEVWRISQNAMESETILRNWQAGSQRRRQRVLREVKQKNKIGMLNQFELASWIEDAPVQEEPEVVKALFSILNKEWFTPEHWFEIEQCFNHVQDLLRRKMSPEKLLDQWANELSVELSQNREFTKAFKSLGIVELTMVPQNNGEWTIQNIRYADERSYLLETSFYRRDYDLRLFTKEMQAEGFNTTKTRDRLIQVALRDARKRRKVDLPNNFQQIMKLDVDPVARQVMPHW